MRSLLRATALVVSSLSPLLPAQPQTTPASSVTRRPQPVPAKSAPAQPAQSPVAQQPKLTLNALDFLVGTWSAKPTSDPSAPAQPASTYTFRRDLANHALQRTTSLDHCTTAQSLDCQHHDQLTIFPDAADPHGTGLNALYLDSEGHVIRYIVTLPDPQTVLLQSLSAPGAPHFRLVYHLEGSGAQATLAGRFEGTAPGSDAYHPYLEWSGVRQ